METQRQIAAAIEVMFTPFRLAQSGRLVAHWLIWVELKFYLSFVTLPSSRILTSRAGTGSVERVVLPPGQ